MPFKPKTFRPMGVPEPAERRRAYDRDRAKAQPWRKWYSLKRYRDARSRYLLQHPRCTDCGLLFGIEHLELDHIIPHDGNPELFWSPDNWAGRCKGCHSIKTRKGL